VMLGDAADTVPDSGSAACAGAATARAAAAVIRRARVRMDRETQPPAVTCDRDGSQAPRPARGDHGLVRGRPRRDRRQRRAAGHRARPRWRPGDAAVGLQRLPARAGVADPRRRLARRRARRAPRVLDRRVRLRGRVARLRGRLEHRVPDRGARRAGDLRRAADAERAGRDRRRVPAGRAWSGDRVVDRVVGQSVERRSGRGPRGRASRS
jgi:hypothetical protein